MELDATITEEVIPLNHDKKNSATGHNGRLSLRIVLPPAINEEKDAGSPQKFIDAETEHVNGHDVDKEYERVMEQAMEAYLIHSQAEKLEPMRLEPLKSIGAPRGWSMAQKPLWFNLSACRSARPPQSARVIRAVRVPPTVSMNQELDVLESSLPAAVRPKCRPLTATRIRYPITGKMSQYPFVNTKSRSEQTTPVKIPKPANGNAQSQPTYSYGGGLFLKYGSKPRDFTIHPDWVSENVQIAKLTLTDRNAQSSQEYLYATYPPRRCQSAPPPQYRNPITWQ